MAYKHGHCVIPTVALLKQRETLPEPEWSPLGGGTTLFFFHCLNSMFPLVPSAGSNQETEIHEELTSSFYRTNNGTSCQSKDDHHSHRSFFLSSSGRGQVAGGSSVQMKIRAGKVNGTLQPRLDTFEQGASWIIQVFYSLDLLLIFIWHHNLYQLS